MTQTITYNGGTALAGVVRRSTIHLTESAHLGETGMGSLVVDDDAAAYDIVGLKDLIVEQSLASPTRLFTGTVAERTYRRGSVQGHVAATREIEVSLVDLNARLGFRVVSGDDGDRPAETAGERMTWLLASGYLDLADTGLVVYPTTPMDAADYRGQTASNVVSDCATTVGYNYFARWDSGSAALFFDDSNTSTALSSTSRISNVAADVDGTTTHAPFDGAELKRSPEGVRSGMYVPYLRGAVYRTDTATASAFAERDGVAPSASVDDEITASDLGDRLLLEAAVEEDTITCSIAVWPANVNDIRAGDRLEVKFSHFPGYEDWAWVRVTQRTVTQPSDTDSRYQIDLELKGLGEGSPATVAAEATIFFSNDDNGYTGDNAIVSWRKSGDSDPGDFIASPLMNPSVALSGPLAYSVGAATPPFATGGGWWNGIEVLTDGTLHVYFATDLNVTFSAASPPTISWQILVNGAMVAEHAEVATCNNPPFAGICGWTPFRSVSATIDVVAGDVISARIANIAGSPRVIPLGTGDNKNCLVVSGTLLAP